MNRITMTWLVFLALATASGGIAYQNLQSLIGGTSSIWNMLTLAMSAVVFGFAMLVLGRIMYLTAQWEKMK